MYIKEDFFLGNCMNKMNGKQCNVIALLQFMLLHGNKALQPVIQPCATTNLNVYFLRLVVDQNISHIALLSTMVLSPSPFFSVLFIELQEQHSYLNYP